MKKNVFSDSFWRMGHWTIKLGIQTSKVSRVFFVCVCVFRQLHFGQWSSLPFCMKGFNKACDCACTWCQRLVFRSVAMASSSLDLKRGLVRWDIRSSWYPNLGTIVDYSFLQLTFSCFNESTEGERRMYTGYQLPDFPSPWCLLAICLSFTSSNDHAGVWTYFLLCQMPIQPNFWFKKDAFCSMQFGRWTVPEFGFINWGKMLHVVTLVISFIFVCYL